MKTLLRIAAMSLLFLAGARAQEPEGAYVYLGSQSGGTSGTMVFVNNQTLGRDAQGNATASTLWISYPGFPRTGEDAPFYLVKNDVYHCKSGLISHRRTRVFSRYHHLVSDSPEYSTPIPVKAGSLAALVHRKICAASDVVDGAENSLPLLPITANLVLILSAPKTGEYAYPRPPQPVTIGTYPFGIAPTENMPLPPGGAWRIPSKGGPVSMVETWRAPDGHIVFEYYRTMRDGGHTDYFDTVAGRDLFPDQSYAMAHSPAGLLGEKLRPPGLRQMNKDMFRFVRPAGKDVTMQNDAGRICPVPYYSYMQLEVEGAPEEKVALFHRRRPYRLMGDCYTVSTLHYESEWPDFLAGDRDGFFAQSDTAAGLIRFDWHGHSAFFSGQDDVIAVPYEELLAVLQATLPDETVPPDQDSFRKAEALIAHYAALQRKGASPFSALH